MDPEQIPLRDLHLPDAVSWWPLAPGWWLLIALSGLALIYLLRLWLRTRARGAARRYALRELNALLKSHAEHGDLVQFSARASALLRRTMLAYAPRRDVAGLTGDAWLHWLDRDLAQPVFSNGPGRLLLDLPYRNPQSSLPDADVERLIAALRHRLATPVGGVR